jgi:hypothetical protein
MKTKRSKRRLPLIIALLWIAAGAIAMSILESLLRPRLLVGGPWTDAALIVAPQLVFAGFVLSGAAALVLRSLLRRIELLEKRLALKPARVPLPRRQTSIVSEQVVENMEQMIESLRGLRSAHPDRGARKAS